MRTLIYSPADQPPQPSSEITEDESLERRVEKSRERSVSRHADEIVLIHAEDVPSCATAQANRISICNQKLNTKRNTVHIETDV